MSVNLNLANTSPEAAATPYQTTELPPSNIVSINGKEREISKIDPKLLNPEIVTPEKESPSISDRTIGMVIAIAVAIVIGAAITCGILIAPWTAAVIIGGSVFLGLLAVEIIDDSNVY
jgi:hypothetical protein